MEQYFLTSRSVMPQNEAPRLIFVFASPGAGKSTNIKPRLNELFVETGAVSLDDKQNREDEMHNRDFSQILGFDKRSAASLSPCSSSSSCIRRPLHNRLATLKRHKGAVKASSPVFRSRPRAEWLGLYPSISGRNKETICCRSCLNKLFDKETIYIMKKLLRVPPR